MKATLILFLPILAGLGVARETIVDPFGLLRKENPEQAFQPRPHRDVFASNGGEAPIKHAPESAPKASWFHTAENKAKQNAFHRTSAQQTTANRKFGRRIQLDPTAAKAALSEEEHESFEFRKRVQAQEREKAAEAARLREQQRLDPQGWREKMSNRVERTKGRLAKAMTLPQRKYQDRRKLFRSYSAPVLRSRPMVR